MPKPDQPFNLDDLVEWRKTEAGLERVKNLPAYEEPDEESPHGYFEGRKIIGRDTPINKGVSIGGSKREIIVVDDEQSPLLKEAYEGLFQKRRQELIADKNPKLRGLAATLNLTYRYAQELIPYDQEIAESIRKQFPDQTISLSCYLKRKGGVCRHQTLLVGYLLEKMIHEGLITGKVSIQRNVVKVLGGHSWVKFIDQNNQTYIIDPAQRFCGTLEEAKKRAHWSYEEPKK